LQSDLSHRAIKGRIRDLLLTEDFEAAMAALKVLPARRAINPLISFLCSGNDLLRWRAISGMGAVVSRLADTDMESARVVMRRLMWTLNDESGGIGWGAPETMGEITAQHSRLAEEFACILVSYIRPDCNFLEHPVLQRGVLWGLGRLAHIRPGMVVDAASFIRPFLGSSDVYHRGYAGWLLRALAQGYPCGACEALSDDQKRFQFYYDGQFLEATVADAACGNLPPG
jgi:hypothetical protein